MIKDEKLEKVCKDFSMLNEEQQEYLVFCRHSFLLKTQVIKVYLKTHRKQASLEYTLDESIKNLYTLY
jgi:hypothetical protein